MVNLVEDINKENMRHYIQTCIKSGDIEGLDKLFSKYHDSEMEKYSDHEKRIQNILEEFKVQ